ncbi:hypothetical protein [Natranaeroarchaeum sulfidigenes]|uniref:hypothetical protein n=1 Tax=Natranaeroarchaeum sulfidigenes TaxID=2784880 RepID=UPI001EE5CFB7|nr:hypothetical protein [Natranaeroarchaeum sulfidigenes]
MGTETIGIREDVLVDRILDDATADWPEGFGTLPEEDADELEGIVEKSRELPHPTQPLVRLR